jgi:hypothetical protein
MLAARRSRILVRRCTARHPTAAETYRRLDDSRCVARPPTACVPAIVDAFSSASPVPEEAIGGSRAVAAYNTVSPHDAMNDAQREGGAVPRFPGATSWYAQQLAEGVMSIDDMAPIVAALIESRQRQQHLSNAGTATQLEHSSSSRNGAVTRLRSDALARESKTAHAAQQADRDAALQSSVEMLQFANENPDARQCLRSYVAGGGRVARLVLDWAADAGAAVGRWAEALELVLGRGIDHDATVRVVATTVSAVAVLLRSGRLTPSQVEDAMPTDRDLRMISGTPTRSLQVTAGTPADALREYLRGHTARHLSAATHASADGAGTLAPHHRRLIALVAALLQHSSRGEVAAESRGHRAFLLTDNFADALLEWRPLLESQAASSNATTADSTKPGYASSPGLGEAADAAGDSAHDTTAVASILSRPAAVCAVMLGDGALALAAFQKGPRTEAAFRAVQDAVAVAAKRELGTADVASPALQHLRSRCGLRVGAHVVSLPVTTWCAALAQYSQSSVYVERNRVTDRQHAGAVAAPGVHFLSALALALRTLPEQRNESETVIAPVFSTILRRLRPVDRWSVCRELGGVELLVRHGAWAAAAGLDRAVAADVLWRQGNVEAALALMHPTDVNAEFGRWVDARPDGTPAWHAALALLSVATRAGGTPTDEAIVRTLKAFAAPEAPTAAVDVLVQLKRPESAATKGAGGVVELLLRAVRVGPTLTDGGGDVTTTRIASHDSAARALAVVASRVAHASMAPATLRAAFEAAVEVDDWAGALRLLAADMLPNHTRPYPGSVERLGALLRRGGHDDACAAMVRAVSSSAGSASFLRTPTNSVVVEPSAVASDADVPQGVTRPQPPSMATALTDRQADGLHRSLLATLSSRRWEAALAVATRLEASAAAAHRVTEGKLDDVLRLCVNSGSWAGAGAALGMLLRRPGAVDAVSEAAKEKDLSRLVHRNPGLFTKALVAFSREGRWHEALTAFALAFDHDRSTGSGSPSAGRRELVDKCLGLAAKACRVAGHWGAALRTFTELARRDGTSFAALTEVVAACMGAGFPLSRVQLWLHMGRDAGAIGGGSERGGEDGGAGEVLLGAVTADATVVGSAVGMSVAFAVLAAQARAELDRTASAPPSAASDRGADGGAPVAAWRRALTLFASAAASPTRRALLTTD